MGRKRYYFPYVAKCDPKYHVAVTSKTLMERVHEAVDVFKKYDENSDSCSPSYILFLMAQQNESLLELSACASAPVSESTSQKVKAIPESSSPERRNPSASGSNRKNLSFGDSVKSENLKTESSSGPDSVFDSPPKESSATSSKVTDLVPFPCAQHQGLKSTETSSITTSAMKPESPINKSKNDNITTYEQENVSPSEKAKMAKKPSSESPVKEPKIPAIPVKDEKDVSKPAKRPSKLFESSLTGIPEFVSPAKKLKALIFAADDDKMDISPDKGDEMCGSPIGDRKDIALSPDKSGSSQKIDSVYSLAPIVKDGGVEMDMFGKSEGNPGPSSAVSLEEIENLDDDPSRVESLRKAVEDRLKDFNSPKKTKGNFSHSEKKSSNLSPRKSRKINSPCKDVKKTKSPNAEIESPGSLSNSNVINYLKLRFKSVLSHRNECMDQIYNFLKELKGDVDFLISYSRNVQVAVQDIPIEVPLTKDLRNLKDNLIKNAKELCNHLRPLKETLKVDIPLWARDLSEIQKLSEKNEHFLSEESVSLTYVAFLREYESNLRVIWERMDRRVLLGDGMMLSVLKVSSNFIKLTKDFAKFLVMVGMMKPSSIASSEAEEKRLKISWR